MSRNMLLRILFFAMVVLIAAGARPAAADEKKPVLRIATTTSTVDSGLLDYLLPHFERKFGVKTEVISVGTGKAIKHGENGDVDVVLVHARELEDKFVKDGYGTNRRDVMYNDFIIAGPKRDSAGIAKKKKNAAGAFKVIAAKEARFVSRGDKSGTDIKEKEIWKKAGITPSGSWFIESGQGMGATLTMADEMSAYTLVDRATFVSYTAKNSLVALVEGDPMLNNPYGVIAVDPKRNPHVNYALAEKFIGWMTSKEGQKLIGAYKVNGVRLFVPDAKPASKKKKK